MPQLHKFEIPNGEMPITLVIRELTASEVLRCATRAITSKIEHLALARAEEEELRRLGSLYQYGDLQVGSEGWSTAVALSEMPAKHHRYLDAAIARVHDISGDERDALLASHEALT